ncbi:MAG: Ig-like domain-containing protein, partial [Candidatus Bathyarchaeota archaeon]|nr:Ig-like domain-containing protein [Candidatus Bathyarchaeota archaeon]
DSVTDTVTVHGLGGDFPIPVGTVDLWVEHPADMWTYFGTKGLVDGQAAFTYTPLEVGTYRFKAIYTGDSNYEGSGSAQATEVLVVVPP